MSDNKDHLTISRDMSQYEIVMPPKPVGWWQITPDVDGRWCTRFAVYKKPEEHHIKNTEDMFGWKWIPDEELNKDD